MQQQLLDSLYSEGYFSKTVRELVRLVVKNKIMQTRKYATASMGGAVGRLTSLQTKVKPMALTASVASAPTASASNRTLIQVAREDYEFLTDLLEAKPWPMDWVSKTLDKDSIDL